MTLSDQILISKIIATNEFSNFIDAARKFCSFIETYQPDTPRNFISLTQNHLLSLYNVGNCLLDVDEKSDKKFENQLNESEYQKTLHFIADRLYDYRYYWYVYDPTTRKKDVGIIYGDLYEDLGTIYKFLKQSLLLFSLKSPAAKQNAIWDFKWYFDKHWSTHCANAIYAIHHFLQKDR